MMLIPYSFIEDHYYSLVVFYLALKAGAFPLRKLSLHKQLHVMYVVTHRH